MRKQRAHKEFVEVNAATQMTDRQRRELGAFARYCAARLERQLGMNQTWSVTLARRGGRADAVVRVGEGQHEISARGSSSDLVLAIWDAMCQVEQPLRELLTAHHRAA